jgi:hypothetical protein
MRMIVNMGGSAFHSTTSSITRNPVSMLVHGNELSGKPPAGKGDGTGDGSGKSKRHRLRDPSDCVQRQTRIQIEVSDHQRAAQMSITDTSQSDVQGAESGKEGSKGQVQKSQKLFTQGYGGAIQTTLDPLLGRFSSILLPERCVKLTWMFVACPSCKSSQRTKFAALLGLLH